jgi:hypothetical protein
MSNPNKKLIAASAYPDMLVEAVPRGNGCVFVTHIGFPEDLIAAGVATVEMLALPGKKGAGKGRVDPEGFRFLLERYFVTRNGQPVRRCRVRRLEVPLPKALQFPGVAEALEARARHEKDRCREAGAPLPAAHQGKVSTAQTRNRSHLRLVIDNTREARP